MGAPHEMQSKLQHLKQLRQIFEISVECVRPKNLLSAANNYNLVPQEILTDRTKSWRIQIQGKSIPIDNKKCYVVGFGKAVLGMAVQVEKSLGDFLTSGIISIPAGTQRQFKDKEEMHLKDKTRIQVFEGAPGNQPDEVAMAAAKKIKSLAKSLTSNDILFVLISGGGSALLPLPREPLTLTEKMELIKALANQGATIQEMNTVRIALSDIKGGRLAADASQAAAVISFIISDIVGDPVDLIASAPTCASNSKISAKQILQTYGMWQGLPQHIQKLIEEPDSKTNRRPGPNNCLYVVGDNRVATAAAVKEALVFNYNPFIASTTLQGKVQDIVEKYIQLLKIIYDYNSERITIDELKTKYPFDPKGFQHFLKTLVLCRKTNKPMLLILAGEPTVKVQGRGLGGRNQELALRMSVELHRNPLFEKVIFLSAGTDGIDGPTPAAGAFACKEVIEVFLQEKNFESLKSFVDDNNSYNFYKNLLNGNFHITTGHTGTNVMDLHLLLIP